MPCRKRKAGRLKGKARLHYLTCIRTEQGFAGLVEAVCATGIVIYQTFYKLKVTLLQQGRLKFVFDDGEKLLEAGEVMQIPPHAPHEVLALEDSFAIDLFSPIRADWISGDDAYLRR